MFSGLLKLVNRKDLSDVMTMVILYITLEAIVQLHPKIFNIACVAQSVEHQTFNLRV